MIEFTDLCLFLLALCFLTLALHPKIHQHTNAVVDGLMAWFYVVIAFSAVSLLAHNSDDHIYNTAWLIFLGGLTLAVVTHTGVKVFETAHTPECKECIK